MSGHPCGFDWMSLEERDSLHSPPSFGTWSLVWPYGLGSTFDGGSTQIWKVCHFLFPFDTHDNSNVWFNRCKCSLHSNCIFHYFSWPAKFHISLSHLWWCRLIMMLSGYPTNCGPSFRILSGNMLGIRSGILNAWATCKGMLKKTERDLWVKKYGNPNP